MNARVFRRILPPCLLVLFLYQYYHRLNPATAAPTIVFMIVILCIAALAAFGRLTDHRHLAASVAGSLAICGVYLLTCNAWVDIIGDNIAYIRDARRLAAGEGVLDSQYGLGVKTMLIPAVVLFPDSVTALKATVALSGFLFPFCTFLVLREFIDNGRALLIALISGAFWLAVEYSNIVTADMPFPAFLMLALWAIVQYIKQPGISWKWLIAAACAAGWAYHVKSPSIYLVIAATIYCALRKEIKKPLLLVACVSVWVLPWVMYLKVNFPESQGYLGMINQIAAGIYIPEGEAGSFWRNFLYYFFQKNPVDYLKNMEYMVLPRLYINDLQISSNWRPVGWLVLILIGIGFVFGRTPANRKPLSLLRSLEVHDWFFMGYLATLFVLPGSPARYMLPILPLMFLYIFSGAEKICTSVPGSANPLPRSRRNPAYAKHKAAFRRPVLARHVPALLACVFLLPSLFVDYHIIKNQRMTPGYHRYWKTYYEASIWMRDNIPTQSRVSTRKPGLVWFWSRREADGYPRAEDPAEALQALSKFDYILLDNIPIFKEKLKYIMPAIKAYPKRFKVIHATEAPRTYVIKIIKTGP